MSETGDDLARQRVSDADRYAVSESLREAAGAGRLDADELDERLDAAFAAKTYGDLAVLVVDLPGVEVPGHAPSPRPPAAGATGSGLVRRPTGWVQPHGDPAASRSRQLALFSGVERRGDWLVPAATTVVATMGGVHLDLRRARFAAPDVEIRVVAVMGGVHVVVPPDVDVTVDGLGVMGAFQGPDGRVEAALVPGSPRVRITGFAFWGGVSVERKHLRP